ncbi:MAG: trypsin-like peptidase domain-containing protein [Bacillota bacterium]|nr:trypsin-like peptidase domain-containing protein [Bacillota bacterium]
MENKILTEMPQYRLRRGLLLALAILLTMAACFAAGVYLNSIAYADESQELSTTSIVAMAADSVVEISTESVTTGQSMRQYIVEGAGSGVVIRSDGYIITNNHVIEGASKITVTLRSGESYEAALVGTDETTDLALLKVDATGLTTATVGSSAQLAIGDTAIAIGNPLGELGGTVTQGIISALDREITLDGRTMNLLQTDAAINPGNSGGGLFNGQGELIGIVVAKSSGSDVEGLGFAIPVDDAMEVLEQLLSQGYVSGRVDVGMEFQDLTQRTSYMSFFNMGSQSAVYVSSVNKGSNAEKAGFRSGDRIVSINGAAVSSASDATALLEAGSVGDRVSIVVVRDNQQATLTLTLEEYIPD